MALVEDPQAWSIRSLHQIEITSRCNLRCPYCIHPTMFRPKQDMDGHLFLKSLEWVKHYVAKGTQGELNLAGTGESTMHPAFVEYVKLARAALGWDRRLLFTTNGILVNEELVEKLKPFRIGAFVSLHRPEAAKKAVDLFRDAGMLLGVSVDPAMSAVDWAGQVDWQVTTPAFGSPCDWRHQGWAMVLSDGRICTCCFFDSKTGEDGILGHVEHAVGEIVGRPYSLCPKCHLDVGIEGWRDRVEGRKARA